ncbi:nitrite/sulfite reductase [Clostridium sp. AL.422]|uniref:nitrite/sulfite reductase n=1 Tax=Clostridium TaxID=1485 RepID=UPI00293DA3B7|nr:MULTISPECIES: nitrite/sulfite reductase [unclassified Clostridium]MDV4150101.1 nitrite/sulfite reductase [Clostridium sp. AL.422]
MENLKEVLYGEIEGFREKGHKFVNGEMNLMQFKHDSGGFGVYAHKGGKEFMIRLRIPSGIMRISEMLKVYDFAERYGLEKIHFTTRQAIQLHGLSIDEICDLMKEALDNDIYTRGAGGDYPRNVAMSPLSGVDSKEAFDVTPYAVAIGNYFLERIYTYKLPRKLKVSVSSGEEDAAHCTVQDLGFVAVNKDGKEYFEIYLGGGLGQNPKMSVKYQDLIEPKDILYYVEGMVRMFIAEGDYENRNRARIRYILDRMGEKDFLDCYGKHVNEVMKEEKLDITVEPKVYNKEGTEIELKNSRLFKQKQKGLYTVYLHPIGGQLPIKDLKLIIDLISKFEDVEIRLAMSEGIYFRNLNGNEAEKLLDLTESMGAKTKFEQSISCIGIPICQIGLCNSQGTLNAVIDYFKEKNYRLDILPKMHFSGCQNSCGVHQISAIGFTGKKKRVGDKVDECFTLFIGGAYGVGDTRLGVEYGDLPASIIPEFLLELAKNVENANLEFINYVSDKEDEFRELVNKYAV